MANPLVIQSIHFLNGINNYLENGIEDDDDAIEELGNICFEFIKKTAHVVREGLIHILLPEIQNIPRFQNIQSLNELAYYLFIHIENPYDINLRQDIDDEDKVAWGVVEDEDIEME